MAKMCLRVIEATAPVGKPGRALPNAHGGPPRTDLEKVGSRKRVKNG
ncbi:hypothetical protein ABH922_002009 [Rhodococcus sp. 27YEA15]